jgi:hypothetical protein
LNAQYDGADEPRLPSMPERTIAELDSDWLCQWRDDTTDAVAAALSTFEARMGYPPGDNRVAVPLCAGRLAEIDEKLPRLHPDLVLLARVLGETWLPDIGNGWYLLSPLYQARVGPPYNVDVVLFAGDGGGTNYAIPVSEARPVLRLREVAEVAGVYDGYRVDVTQRDLRSFMAGLRDAVRLFARNGGIADL